MDTQIEKGLGDKQYKIAVYIANIPPMEEYQQLTQILSLLPGEIQVINQHCGNGWRKVFNVYAKLLFALDPQRFVFSQQAFSWQQYRDQNLLQSDSQTALIFGSPEVRDHHNAIRIICGKTHGQQSGGQFEFDWLDCHFAICREHNIIICPYFDYRQLTNQRIVRLAQLINSLK
ncbi:DUF6942 family protein [Neptunicella sp. SCSIO 80796]|uniref:DUF6942 family protein n=1 Tax=Neptunicella plasticusilytica TaxID=3117012 RepID=UPI003A4D5182